MAQRVGGSTRALARLWRTIFEIQFEFFRKETASRDGEDELCLAKS